MLSSSRCEGVLQPGSPLRSARSRGLLLPSPMPAPCPTSCAGCNEAGQAGAAVAARRATRGGWRRPLHLVGWDGGGAC